MRRPLAVFFAVVCAALPQTGGATNADDALFMEIANAAPALYAAPPAFITYRVHGRFAVMGLEKIDREVTVRSADQLAIVHDEATGRELFLPPFPAPPNFDALSRYQPLGVFTARTALTDRDVDFRITNVRPFTFKTGIREHVDAIVLGVAGYRIQRAPDENGLGRLVLEPLGNLKKRPYYLSEVWFARDTHVPARIVWRGADDYVLDGAYQILESHWLLSRLRFEYKAWDPSLRRRIPVSFDVNYDDYRFADTPPDPRLRALIPAWRSASLTR